MSKVVDARTITLGMWVIGAEEDGSMPTGTAAAQFDENFRKLRSLLWTPNRQITLTKRFYVNGVLKTASAKAQFVSGIAPVMQGRTRAVFTVDLRLSDPYFYGPEVNVALANGSQTVTIGGDDITRAIKLHVDGPRVNVKVRNNTLDVDVEHISNLSSGDDLDIDVKNYTAVTDTTLLPAFNSVGSIRHTGSPHWLLLQPGANSITVSSTSGTGLVTLTYQEAWL